MYQFFEIDSPIDSFTLVCCQDWPSFNSLSVDVRIKRLNCKIDRAGSMRRWRRKLTWTSWNVIRKFGFCLLYRFVMCLTCFLGFCGRDINYKYYQDEFWGNFKSWKKILIFKISKNDEIWEKTLLDIEKFSRHSRISFCKQNPKLHMLIHLQRGYRN